MNSKFGHSPSSVERVNVINGKIHHPHEFFTQIKNVIEKKNQHKSSPRSTNNFNIGLLQAFLNKNVANRTPQQNNRSQKLFPQMPSQEDANMKADSVYLNNMMQMVPP